MNTPHQNSCYGLYYDTENQSRTQQPIQNKSNSSYISNYTQPNLHQNSLTPELLHHNSFTPEHFHTRSHLNQNSLTPELTNTRTHLQQNFCTRTHLHQNSFIPELLHQNSFTPKVGQICTRAVSSSDQGLVGAAVSRLEQLRS